MRGSLMLPAVLLAIGCACGSVGGRLDGADEERSSEAWWDYVVRVGPEGRRLSVAASFESGAPGRFELDAAASEALERPRLESGEALRAVEGGWRLPVDFELGDGPVRLRWEVDLERIAPTRNSRRVTDGERTAYLAPAGLFLLRPAEGWRDARARIRFELSPGVRLASGMMRGRAPETFVVPASRLDHLPATVLGDFEHLELDVAGSSVDVAVLPGPRSVSLAELERFVAEHSRAVADFYGRFPVAHALVVVLPSPRGGYGRANGSGGASVLYLLDRREDFDAVMGDWVLVHELMHFACPLLRSEHHWFEEGLSTYLEPLVRHAAGWQSGEAVWSEFFVKMHNGLPAEGDRGLDRTRTWGRTYWGGALFCMLADLEIRRLSDNALGLRDAMRGVVERGGSILRPATMRATLEAGDEALGLRVLVPLWEEMSETPVTVDLEQLWADLGISRVDGRLRFDDSAPLAALREAIASTGGERSQSSD